MFIMIKVDLVSCFSCWAGFPFWGTAVWRNSSRGKGRVSISAQDLEYFDVSSLAIWGSGYETAVRTTTVAPIDRACR